MFEPGDVVMATAPDGSVFADVVREVTVINGDIALILTRRSWVKEEDVVRVPWDFPSAHGAKILGLLRAVKEGQEEDVWMKAYNRVEERGETGEVCARAADAALAAWRSGSNDPLRVLARLR